MSRDSRTIHFVSLGCPKNRVDSEVMLGVAHEEGYSQVPDASAAEVIVVNTCGFIDAAKEESIQTILELAQNKRAGRCQKLVVTGCLSQRYSQDLAEGLPEVDHLLGSSDMLGIAQVLRGHAERMLVGNPAGWVVRAEDPRVVSTPGASAYLKLAEGCNRSCAFCVIPSLRGKQRSREPEDILREAQGLVASGVKELNLVSQDTIAYGRDLPTAPKLAQVVENLAEHSGAHWVRLFYLYPERLDPALVELLAQHPRVLPYVDMPLQHAADSMLRRMRRGHGGPRLREVIERLRREIPDLVLRSAFIVGHPGESEAEFQELCDFVEWAQIDRLGVFRYSDEEDAPSHQLADKVAPGVAAARVEELMSLQQPISLRKNEALLGRRLSVLVEGPSEESELVMQGRHRGQAPEIDGCVYLSGESVEPGQLVCAEIMEAQEYDLLGEVLSIEEAATTPATQALLHLSQDGRRVLRTV